MTIESIDRYPVVVVTMTDGRKFTRHSSECWTETVGESEEVVYGRGELEALFQAGLREDWSGLRNETRKTIGGVAWPPCPFCGEAGLESVYGSFGTELYCNGCHGRYIFPAFEGEVMRMWRRASVNA